MGINKIREAVDVLPRASNGKFLRVPSELRDEILHEAKTFEGRLVDFASQVGISYTTIAGWVTKSKKRESKPSLFFRRLATREEKADKLFSVEGPKGLRVQGLSFKEIAILFKEVSVEF